MKRLKAEKYKKLYVGIANLLEMIILTLIFYNLWDNQLNILQNQKFLGKGNVLVVFVYITMLVLLMRMWGGFKLGYSKFVNLLLAQFLALTCVAIIEGVIVILIVGKLAQMPGILVRMIWMTGIDFFFLVFADIFFVAIYGKLFPPFKVLQINGKYENYLYQKIATRDDKYEVVEEISIFENEQVIFEKIKKYDAILLNDIPTEKRKDILKYCFANDIRVYFTPKISDIIVKGSDELNFFDTPLFLARNLGLSEGQKIVKRVLDIILSGIALIVLSPLFLIVSICIKLEDGGSVFYKQKRCTYGGRVFWIYKFRSMIENAEEDGKSHPAIQDDDRITKVGKVIRPTRIDELPQLINILIGDMSIVGPRPERIEHVEMYCEEIPEFSYRLKVKGGLTGYAQVYGRYNTTALDKLKMDMIYITNYSLLLDAQIVLETVKIIFQKESTEGFSEKKSKEIHDNYNTR